MFFNIIHYEFKIIAMHALHFPHLSILQAKLNSLLVFLWHLPPPPASLKEDYVLWNFPGTSQWTLTETE